MTVLASVLAVGLVIAGLAIVYVNAHAAGNHEAVTAQQNSITFARGNLARSVITAQAVETQLTSVMTPSPATMPAELALGLANTEHALASAIASAQRTPATVFAADLRVSAVNAAVASAGVTLAQVGPAYAAAVAQAIAAAPHANGSVVKALNQSMAILAASVKSGQGVRNAIDVVTSRMQLLAASPQTAAGPVGGATSKG